MKKLLISSLIVASLSMLSVATAQINTTNTGTAENTVLDWAKGATTNIIAAGYGIYDSSSKQFGGGVGVAYSLFDSMVMPSIRAEYIGSTLWFASGSVELRPPQKWLGKFPITPFALGGVRIPLAGAGAKNGDPVPFTGAGIWTPLGKGWGAIADVEWNLSGVVQSPASKPMYRLGITKHF